MSRTKAEDIAAYKQFIATVGVDSYFAHIATPNAVRAVEQNISNDFSPFLGLYVEEAQYQAKLAQIEILQMEIAELKKHDIRALRLQRMQAEGRAVAAAVALLQATDNKNAADEALREAARAMAV